MEKFFPWRTVRQAALLGLFAAGCATGGSNGETGAAGDPPTTTGGGEGGGGQGAGGAPDGLGGAPGEGGSPDPTTTSGTAGGGGDDGGAGGSGAGTTGEGGGPPPIVCEDPASIDGFPLETEGNDTKTHANALFEAEALVGGVTGSLCPIADIDYYAIEITEPGQSLKLNVGSGAGECPDIALSIRVVAPNGSLVTQVSSSAGECPEISPLNGDPVGNLAIGTYFVSIESELIQTLGAYALDAELQAPACGDGLVQAGEQCDDGNTEGGDGCEAECTLEGNYGTEIEPNNTEATGTSLATPEDPAVFYDGMIGAIDPAGDADFYTFEVTAEGSLVVAEVTDGLAGCPDGFDSLLKLYFNPPGTSIWTEIASDDEGGADSCSKITPASHPAAGNLALGTYALRVTDYFSSDTDPFYVLKVNVTEPGCGDSIRSGEEQCDDGNEVAGDGCDANCLAEPGSEIEPNDVGDTATPLSAGLLSWKGSISPVGDFDYYAFDIGPEEGMLPVGSTLAITVHKAGDPELCGGIDPNIRLLMDTMPGPQTNLTEIAFAEDNWGSDTSYCSTLDGSLSEFSELANMAEGRYYLLVRHYSDSGAFAYEVSIDVL